MHPKWTRFYRLPPWFRARKEDIRRHQGIPPGAIRRPRLPVDIWPEWKIAWAPSGSKFRKQIRSYRFGFKKQRFCSTKSSKSKNLFHSAVLCFSRDISAVVCVCCLFLFLCFEESTLRKAPQKKETYSKSQGKRTRRKKSFQFYVNFNR